MNKIITLTVNPAIDKSTTVAGIQPNRKLRCSAPEFEPGGGGINISRVIHELGGDSLCMLTSGGYTGRHLQSILHKMNILHQIIPIEESVRENLSVMDTTNNQQYRFGMPGPKVNESGWKNILTQLEVLLTADDFLVASGSLCPGMPVDFYAQVSEIATSKKVKFVLDTSGEPLVLGAKAGVFLLKPNLGELATLCGKETISFLELESVAKNFLEQNPCEVLVVSLGAQGAMMVTEDAVEYIAAPIVYLKSTIGAGDSMVAGMVLSLAQGKSLSEMAQYGVACGTAATMTPGTQLCKVKDVDELFKWIVTNSVPNKKIKINA